LTGEFIQQITFGMDLLALKAATGLTWEALAERSGIAVGNLHAIAHGKKRWGPETGEGLLALGVDLNEQTRTYMRQKREREPVAA
jgi:transcriptional regulator with XRE-family HTH domain